MELEERPFKSRRKLKLSSVLPAGKITYDDCFFLGGQHFVHDWQVGVATALVDLGRRFALVFLPCEIQVDKNETKAKSNFLM
jgi:hypothetical protein